MKHELVLSPKQSLINASDARFRCLISGRRFGKTYLACVEMLIAAKKTDSLIYYVSPSYRQSKIICWKMIRELFYPLNIIRKVNETELSLTLVNGARIYLRGADYPDSLRGVGLDFVVMDEFALIKQEAWVEALRPALADRQGKALFISSPKGFNWAYDLWLHGQSAQGWESWQFTTAQGGNVPLSELEEARSEMDARIYRQEFEASFENLAGQIYNNFSRAGNLDDEVTDIPSQPLLVGMDFNVNPMSAVLAVANGSECWVFDCIELMTSNTEEMARELRNRYPEREIICYPDASGKARKTSASIGETDFSILQSYGIRIIAPSADPPVADRINNMQANLCDAKGDRHLLIHPRCKPLIKSIEGHCYKEGTSIPDKTSKPDLSHFNDCMGYLLWGAFHRFRQPAYIPSNVVRRR